MSIGQSDFEVAAGSLVTLKRTIIVYYDGIAQRDHNHAKSNKGVHQSKFL